MKRLVDHGLMYGNLFTVATPVMRERYNDALTALTGRTTALQEFHVDLSGYSPEVGDELSDPLYLNPNGCNRQFILISVEQRRCPLLGAHFSTSRSILRQFIKDNFSQLVALTARDAVIGELDNSTWKIDDLEDLVTIRNINVQVETTRGLIGDAKALKAAVRGFHESDTDWWDDGVLSRMCLLAEQVGDIKRHSVIPERVRYRKGNFHTSHFGGLYVLRDVPEPAIISCDPDFDAPIPDPYRHIRIDDHAAVSSYLQASRLVENILDVDWLDAKTLLRERTDFMLVDILSELDEPPNLSKMRRAEFRRAARANLDLLPTEFEALSDVIRALEHNIRPGKLKSDQAGQFYLMRANQHDDRDLVNHLLARLTPLDFRQLFICNKELFYQMYSSWPDGKQSYVANFLARTYMVDKHATREDLYGLGLRPAPKPWGQAAEPKSAVEDALRFVDGDDWTGTES